MQVECVQICWKTLRGRGIQWHEGILLQILHTAARHGSIKLATEAFDALETVFLGNFALETHHIEPLLETLVQAGDIKHLNRGLELLRKKTSKIPTELPRFPINEEMTLDKAFDTLQAIHQSGKRVDIILFATLLKECILRQESQRALGYLRMANSIDLKPDANTYHAILGAASPEQYGDLADVCVMLARRDGITLDLTSYAYKEE